ncbi:hypothetical protein ACFQ68_40895 [Amycolatopsis japonica]|uniref:hypothetical protein n=1 Tax=Amycolatopsis japonica TaxID=208439 RepID=UPI0036703393
MSVRPSAPKVASTAERSGDPGRRFGLVPSKSANASTSHSPSTKDNSFGVGASGGSRRAMAASVR